MSGKTGIEWTDATWNPIRGCSRVSEGCRNCYAEKVAYRFSGPGQPYEGLVQLGADGKRGKGAPRWNGQIKFVEEHLLDPLRWKKPRRIFVNSMSDLFHENVTEEMLDRIFAVMALSPQHTFQILTKRPERMLAYLTTYTRQARRGYWMEEFGHLANALLGGEVEDEPKWFREAFQRMRLHYYPDLPCKPETLGDASLACKWPLRNVWLGVSVENQAAADARIPLLLQTPAAVRFLSVEPLLGSVSLRWKNSPGFGQTHPKHLHPEPSAEGRVITDEYDGLRELDWVIVGGESGPGARPMHPDWARSLRDQCVAAGVPFFFKQWGEWAVDHPAPNEDDWSHGHALVTSYHGDIRGSESLTDETTVSMWKAGKKAAGRLLDGREWNEFPGAVRA